MAASDDFAGSSRTRRDSCRGLANITPNDSADLAHVTKALYVGVAGDVRVTDHSGATDTYALGVGWHPIEVTRVYSTGTTATGLIAGWG